MRHRIFITVALLLIFGLAACGAGAPEVEWELGVGGPEGSSLTLSYADLADMPQIELKDILMEKTTGEDTTGSWSGVPLADVLEKAGIADDFVSITAVASDGYAIEISKDELQDAIIALKENGEWIAEADPDHGPIRLVTPLTPANRWVFQLQKIVANAEAGSGIPDNAALKITGSVETEVGWTEEKVISMDAIEVEYTGKDGEVDSYTGVRIADLLGKAKPEASATTLVFVADDGYSAEAPLADIDGCSDCIVAFQNQGGFRIVAPDFPGNVQVKGVVEIQVK